ncbi:MAG: hypothetical protein GEV09_01365 [Pseudonocardiaceae bacterium]|nr:hypothetical protein [Pseudonocardiaceae bacterium]
MNQHALDLDATDTCPLDERCENCGTRDELDVATAATPVGIYCLTLCDACADAVPEPGGWSRAVGRVLEHCGHLGIDSDEMAEELQ